MLPTQIRNDIIWLMGVLYTVVKDPELPCLFAAEGDGILALENMFLQYSNAGETSLNIQWVLENALAKQYDPTLIVT